MTTTEPAEAPAPSRAAVLRHLRRLAAIPAAAPLAALVASIVGFSLASDSFLEPQNLSLILQQVLVVAVLAIGQTLIILTAGIDLSVGTVMALGQIVMTKLALQSGVPPVLAILLGIATCLSFGFLNGALVTRAKLPPFIVTLGTFNIAFALTHIYSNDESFSGLPGPLLFFGTHFSIGSTTFTYGTVLMVVLYAVAWFALTQTAWGRHVYAVGDNPEAARLTGINTNRLLLSVYAVAGLLYGIAAMLLVSRTEIGDPNAGQTTENLDSITAVVLGGTSLFGGRGTIIGTFIGAAIVGVFRNGLILTGFSDIYQYLVTGILVILAVSIDRLLRGRAA